MINKHPIITYAYSFLSEAIIIFLLLLPIFSLYYNWVPYVSYFIITMVICLLFSVFAQWRMKNNFFFLTLPFLICIFYINNFPIATSICISVLFIWRYVRIYSVMSEIEESVYLLMTATLTLILGITLKENGVIFYLLLQFIIIIIGYVSSNIAILQKREKAHFNYRLMIYYTFALIFGGIVTYWFFTQSLLYKLLNGFILIVFSLISRFVELFSFMEDIEVKRWLDNEISMKGDETEEEQLSSLFEMISPMLTIMLVTSIILAIIGFIYLIRIYGSDYSYLGKKIKKSLTYHIEVPRDKVSITRAFKSPSEKTNQVVRRLVLKFEKKATKYNKGRRVFETVEEWLERLGFSSSLVVYQKVRYGDMDVKQEDVHSLMTEIKDIEKKWQKDDKR